ncbi:MAG: hypothetical protein FJ317_06340 [SAR202 cluster bacterium]|nr:hypothetical protein [SAR202 cluster bacterium]
MQQRYSVRHHFSELVLRPWWFIVALLLDTAVGVAETLRQILFSPRGYDFPFLNVIVSLHWGIWTTIAMLMAIVGIFFRAHSLIRKRAVEADEEIAKHRHQFERELAQHSAQPIISSAPEIELKEVKYRNAADASANVQVWNQSPWRIKVKATAKLIRGSIPLGNQDRTYNPRWQDRPDAEMELPPKGVAVLSLVAWGRPIPWWWWMRWIPFLGWALPSVQYLVGQPRLVFMTSDSHAIAGLHKVHQFEEARRLGTAPFRDVTVLMSLNVAAWPIAATHLVSDVERIYRVGSHDDSVGDIVFEEVQPNDTP